MSALSKLAAMLGVRPELAEDALHSERAARAVLTRRSLFAAGAALAGGAAFSFAAPSSSLRVDFWIEVELGGPGLPYGAIGRVMQSLGEASGRWAERLTKEALEGARW